MSAKTKPAIITPYSGPRQVFQASASKLRGHQDLIDSDAFEISSAAVIAQMAFDMADGVKDNNTALAAGFMLKGAMDFLSSFKTFAEIPKPNNVEETIGELQNTDQPRRV